jgi:hypothetical protein
MFVTTHVRMSGLQLTHIRIGTYVVTNMLPLDTLVTWDTIESPDKILIPFGLSLFFL